MFSLFSVVFALASLAVVCSTAIEVLHYLKHGLAETSEIENSRFTTILVSFSIISNTKSLLSPSKHQLSSLDGIRIISMFWLFLGSLYYHNFTIAGFSLHRLSTEVLPKLASFPYIIIRNAYFNYETFFCVSGIILAHSTVQALNNQGGKFYFSKYLLRRLARFLPVVGATILLYFMLPIFGSGPTFKELIQERTSSCEENWLSTLTFTNNLFKIDNEVIK